MCRSTLKAPSGFFDLTIHKTVSLINMTLSQYLVTRLLVRIVFVRETSDNKVFFHLLEYIYIGYFIVILVLG